LADSLTAHVAMPREQAVAATLAELRLAGVDPDVWRRTSDPVREGACSE
jgi:hypothetical protein